MKSGRLARRGRGSWHAVCPYTLVGPSQKFVGEASTLREVRRLADCGHLGLQLTAAHGNGKLEAVMEQRAWSKIKLIATGFPEAATAVKSALKWICSGDKVRLEYSRVAGLPLRNTWQRAISTGRNL